MARTTMLEGNAPCSLDQVSRYLKTDRPDQLWMSERTYFSTWQGWPYVPFVIDVYAGSIVGWYVSKTIHTCFVLDSLERALYAR